MEKVFTFIMMVIDMKEIGKMIKKKEEEYIFIKMVKDMKVNGKMIKKMEKEFIILIMEIGKWEIMKMITK